MQRVFLYSFFFKNSRPVELYQTFIMSVAQAKVDVYRIRTYEGADNRYGVGRVEEWEEKFDQSFDTEKQAQEYIKTQSLQHTTLLTFLIDLPKPKWDAAIQAFCFDDDKYIVHRRFSIGKFNRPQMKKALELYGTTVQNSFLKSV